MGFVKDTWDGVRMFRSNLLRETDWTQLPDAPLTDQEKLQWATYRQQLRDIPQNQTGAEPTEVIFPVDPQGFVFDRQKQQLVKSQTVQETI